ncbi:acetolactate synthase [Psychromonas marina]|uniref:Acetolactate synthase n=1 Tax=Psychromonas marina TaxID=88364 RepID=A0ABQ6E5B7_9GAMM|nr:acetolactate synthase 2 small subunit [Psychromonas marina]GLS92606.1 acetolactate synthase [Psychromonas marina]
MKSQLTIESQNSPELLERLLRVVRHRGFNVQTLQAETTDNEQNLHLSLTVYSEREISLLTKQLEKIFGVTKVSLLAQQAEIKASA